MSLWQIFLDNDGRLAHKWAHYFPIYERHFSRYVGRDVVMFEIGVFRGGSLQLWKRYLGPHARIVGIDIDPKCKQFEESQISIRIGSQSDPEFLHSVMQEFGGPDIVLDDGSHQQPDILASFRTLYDYVDRNGVYMVEDLHTAYWDRFGGGLRRPETFIEVSKGLIDELNARSSQRLADVTDFTETTHSMHFYPDIVAIEKGRYLPFTSIKTGGAPKPSSDS
jgi:hypothetical protein